MTRAVVLVVDDNPENRALAKATLEDEDYRAVVATGGEEGLRAFEREKPDCVLLDIRMPGMDGIAACERMRALPGGVDVPIIFVTAQREVETFDRAKSVGGDDFITKPFRPTELIMRIEAAMKLRRSAVERAELYELIRKQRDDLMRMQLQREQLIAFLVHDLKNPVHAIELHARLCARDPNSSEKTRSAAANIQSDSAALLRMITNLLDLSLADEDKLVPKVARIDLPALVAEIIALMEVRARIGNVSIATQIDAPAMSGDPELVRRVIENLVDNAIRYAPEETTVKIEARRDGASVVLRVVDAGTGVPETERQRVFDRFVQGSVTTRTGRGLGLAFCKLAVEAHGGTIWVEDAAPGAAFCVRLDAAD